MFEGGVFEVCVVLSFAVFGFLLSLFIFFSAF